MAEILDLPADCRCFDLARWRLRRGQGWAPHGHRFHEVLWIEHGSIRHGVDGVSEDLGPGAIIWIRCGRTHAAEILDRHGVIYVNLSVAVADVEALRKRLGPSFALWAAGTPAVQHLQPDAVAGLDRLVTALDPECPADRDLLLLHLAHTLRATADADTTALPPALQRALAAVAADAAWDEGVAGLARRAGWSREHTARTVRAALGCPPSTLLHSMRLRRSARALVQDGRPVAEVAENLGFRSLSHFYRGFRAAFGATPAQWRRQRRTGLGLGPVAHAQG